MPLLRRHQSARRHRAGHAHLALATHLRAADAGILLVQNPDRRRRQKIPQQPRLFLFLAHSLRTETAGSNARSPESLPPRRSSEPSPRVRPPRSPHSPPSPTWSPNPAQPADPVSSAGLLAHAACAPAAEPAAAPSTLPAESPPSPCRASCTPPSPATAPSPMHSPDSQATIRTRPPATAEQSLLPGSASRAHSFASTTSRNGQPMFFRNPQQLLRAAKRIRHHALLRRHAGRPYHRSASDTINPPPTE